MSQNERKEMAGRNRGGRLRLANTPGLRLGGRCSGALPQYVSAITGRAQARNLPTSWSTLALPAPIQRRDVRFEILDVLSMGAQHPIDGDGPVLVQRRRLPRRNNPRSREEPVMRGVKWMTTPGNRVMIHAPRARLL